MVSFLLWRLRIIIFYFLISLISIIFFTIFCIPFRFVKVSYNIRYKIAEIFSHIFINLVWFIIGIKYEIEGLEKLPKGNKPFVLIANHQSFWENFFMQIIIPKHSWIIKKELFDIPVFGWGLRMVEPIAVDRSETSSIIQIIKAGKRKINEGLSLIIFPEGTRIKVDRSVKFKPSAAKLAISSEVPIVIMVHNAGVFWPKGFWFQNSGIIKVKILEMMPAEQVARYDARTLTDYMQEKINAEKAILAKEAIVHSH